MQVRNWLRRILGSCNGGWCGCWRCVRLQRTVRRLLLAAGKELLACCRTRCREEDAREALRSRERGLRFYVLSREALRSSALPIWKRGARPSSNRIETGSPTDRLAISRRSSFKPVLFLSTSKRRRGAAQWLLSWLGLEAGFFTAWDGCFLRLLVLWMHPDLSLHSPSPFPSRLFPDPSFKWGKDRPKEPQTSAVTAHNFELS